tara:strand:+ start:286 stop:399 length:114 start_codon:yes stop_codon:yes gene_type:complete
MPFKKLGKNKYKSPSGKIFTLAQIQAYYLNKKKGPKK